MFKKALDVVRGPVDTLLNVFNSAREGPSAMHEPIVQTYLVYVLLSVALTVWVAHTLKKNGRLFLVDAFHGNEPLADSVNHLLVVGFYLLNLGFISYALSTRAQVPDARSAIELLSGKIGAVLAVLGLLHFFNLLLFSRMRARAKNPPRRYMSDYDEPVTRTSPT